MKTLLCALLVLTFIYSSFQLHCWSTGDPHYLTFKRFRYDLYGWYGDFMLAHCKRANFKVISRVRQGQFWRNRGLNNALAIVIDGNIVQHYGSHYFINGRRNANWNTLKHGVRAYVRGNRIDLRGPSGARIVWHYYHIYRRRRVTRRWRNSQYFNNVYIWLPRACNRRAGRSLCGRAISHRDDRRIRTSGYLRSIRFHPRSNKNFFTETWVPRKLHVITKERKWPSNRIRRRCQKFCLKKLKTKNGQYRNCMADCRLAKGNTKRLLGFGKIGGDLKEIMRAGHHKARGTFYAVILLLNKLEKQLLDEMKKLPRSQANARAQLRNAQNKVNRQRGKVAAAQKKLKQLQNAARQARGKLSGIVRTTNKTLKSIRLELARLRQLKRYVIRKHIKTGRK